MKRLGIFCFYDSDGVVDAYVEHILCEAGSVIDDWIIIINGEIKKEDKDILSKYSSQVMIRDNSGYDGGAYADWFVSQSDTIKWDEIDEIVLVNNSFFGPFVSFENIFMTMSSSDSDFWGIRLVDRNAISYIESYFIVFRRKIVEAGELVAFFRNNYTSLLNASYKDVCALFERGLCSYLRYRGYKWDSYVSDNQYDIFWAPDINIIECSAPILKKKCIDFEKYSYQAYERSVEYIKKNSIYPSCLIEDYLRRKSDNIEASARKEPPYINIKIKNFDINEGEVLEFLSKNKDVYIYGAGWIASNIWGIYQYYIRDMRGFIVSDILKNDSIMYGHKVCNIKDIEDGANIIVAMNRENSEQIFEQMRNYNCLYLWNIKDK